MTVPQAVTVATPDALAAAQTATPGEAAMPATTVERPPCVTVAEAELLVLHVTVGVMPVVALTAAVSVTDCPTLIVAVLGATCTLLIAPVAVVLVGWTMLTLSPQAAAMIAVAATNRDERRTLMYDPPRSEEQLYNPAKYADDRTDRQPSLKRGRDPPFKSPHIPLVPFGRSTSGKSYLPTTDPSSNLSGPVEKSLYLPRNRRTVDSRRHIATELGAVM
jgi:hypothetical protein